MDSLATVAVILLAVLHLYILVLEMFLWTTSRGHKAFGLTPEFAKATRVLAANQGLYNGFLAAGLLWGALLGPEGFGIRLFFSSCVVVAGLYGAFSSSRKILFVQGVPGLATLLLVWFSANP